MKPIFEGLFLSYQIYYLIKKVNLSQKVPTFHYFYFYKNPRFAQDLLLLLSHHLDCHSKKTSGVVF